MTAGSHSSTYLYNPYGAFPATWVSPSSPVLADEVTVTCGDCGISYRKRAASAAEAELACQEWLDGHRSEQHPAAAAPRAAEPEHLTLDDGTVLRDRTAKSLGLTGNGPGSGGRAMLQLAAQHLDAAVLQTGKTTLDGADLTAIATLVRAVPWFGS